MRESASYSEPRRWQIDEAERLYMQALSTYPDYKNAHLNLAICVMSI